LIAFFLSSLLSVQHSSAGLSGGFDAVGKRQLELIQGQLSLRQGSAAVMVVIHAAIVGVIRGV